MNTKEYIEKEANNIITSLGKERYVNLSTCNAKNWDQEKHIMMPLIADHLRGKGYDVKSEVNFGVTDWTIINKVEDLWKATT